MEKNKIQPKVFKPYSYFSSYVWSHTRTLNFHEAYRFPEEPLEPEKRKEKYVKFVNHVLRHLQSCLLLNREMPQLWFPEEPLEPDCCVLLLTSFIEASPKLQKLVLELTGILRPQPEIEIKEAPKFSHGSLKVVEVKNYRGRPGDLKLVMYLIDNAVGLEKIVNHRIGRDEMARKVPKHIELDDRNNFWFDHPVYV